MQKSELIEKLERVSELFDNLVDAHRQMQDYEPEDHYVREVTVPPFPGEYQTETERENFKKRISHTQGHAVESAENVYKEAYEPKKPKDPDIKEFREPKNSELDAQINKYEKGSMLRKGVGAFIILCMITSLGSLLTGGFVGIIILLVISYIVFRNFDKKYNAAKEQRDKEINEARCIYDQQQEKLKEEYNQQMAVYEGEYRAYEEKLHKFLEEYKSWREIYLQSIEEEKKIKEKLAADKEAGIEKIRTECYVPAEQAINEENDLVPVKYLNVLDDIIDLLISGRADDLKEAINLYEDMIYKEKQLALEREKEQNRQREEERRRRDEDRRYREQMQFQQDQERQRQREETQRQNDAERRHREEMAQ